MKLLQTLALSVQLGEAHVVGDIGAGTRRVSQIVGGNFAGTLGEGDVIGGGMDWQTLRTDGAVQIDARYLLRRGDALIAAQARGIRAPQSDGPPYFRVAFTFETECADLLWLNTSLFIANGERHDDMVRHTVYRVD